MKRTVSYSRTILSQVMLIDKANSIGNIHGGEIVKMMDSAAAVVAKRHSRSAVVTARIDKLEFHSAAHVGNQITCTANLTFVGTSSMEVLVKVEVEDLKVEEPPRTALKGYFTMVAIDEHENPIKVPQLILESPEEVKAFESGKRRYEKYRIKKLKKLSRKKPDGEPAAEVIS